MKEASGAIQDLMRDAARLFDHAGKINAQVLQIDAFAAGDGAAPLLAELDRSRAQYKKTLARVRSAVAALEAAAPVQAAGAEGPGDRIEGLRQERSRLRQESEARSAEIHRLLGCMRQLQLTSAQLLQIAAQPAAAGPAGAAHRHATSPPAGHSGGGGGGWVPPPAPGRHLADGAAGASLGPGGADARLSPADSARMAAIARMDRHKKDHELRGALRGASHSSQSPPSNSGTAMRWQID
ncbi:hypothetical protein H4R18_004565 [Coemansia javaensis]|uniref:Uncharacterized protein n=1 Tax=Coemansia javaensis TaxID=2761396 RepID=A0A9W8H5B0_9FUNG|nr:hypothetical protein H4R18_004565 [Coemansia javaensis]